jgi:AcrR family transcriptional regulator
MATTVSATSSASATRPSFGPAPATCRGFDAPLEDVAGRAGVGIATLYRNFPTREVLVENVYIVEVQAVLAEAGASLELSPWDGLTRWLRRFVEYLGTKRAIATAIDPDSEV